MRTTCLVRGLVIDTVDFTGTPIASIHLPHRIPPGFHGNWVAD